MYLSGIYVYAQALGGGDQCSLKNRVNIRRKQNKATDILINPYKYIYVYSIKHEVTISIDT